MNFIRFFIDDARILFCRELLKNKFRLISVTVTLEKQLLCQEGFYYRYYTVLDDARKQFTIEDYSGFLCRPAFRRLKLTKEELSRGKRYSFYIISWNLFVFLIFQQWSYRHVVAKAEVSFSYHISCYVCLPYRP